jgi:hypothetical protein
MLWSPVVLAVCFSMHVAAAHALHLFPLLLADASPSTNTTSNSTAAAAPASPFEFALTSAYYSPLQFFSEASSVMIIAARASSTLPLALSALLLPVHIAMTIILSIGVSSFRGHFPPISTAYRFY